MFALKNRDIPWNERLSSAYTIFTSDDFLPRKEQAIIDWLTFSLHNNDSKSSMTENERLAAWTLLKDVFDSSRIKSASKSGQNIILKSWFLKVITDQLHVGRISLSPVVACLDAIIRENCFKSFLLLPFDSLLKLVISCCEIIWIEENNEIFSRLCSITEGLIVKLDVLLSRQGLSPTVFASYANHLFVPAVKASRKLKERNSSVPLLNHVIEILLHCDAIKHYERYLREKEEISSNKRENFAENLFKILEQNISGEKKLQREMYLDVVPLMFSTFLKNCKNLTVKSNRFGMFKTMMKLVSYQGNPKSNLCPDETLLCWSEILKLSLKDEIYNIASDDSAQQSEFHHAIVNLMLSKPYISSLDGSWYLCVSHLLSINHTCVERNVNKVLSLCWQQASQLSVEALELQSSFMCSLIDTYSKLRQLPKLIDILLNCVFESRECEDQPVMYLPASVLSYLGDNVSLMPASLCLETFTNLYDSLIARMSSAEICDEVRLCTVAEIVNMYSQSMRLYDNSVAQSVKSKLPESLSRIQDRLMDLLSNSKRVMPVSLLILVDGFCSVYFMVFNYVTAELCPLKCASAAIDQCDMSCSEIMRYIKVKLLMHQLTHLQLSSSSLDLKSAEMHDLIASIVDQFNQSDSNNSYDEWDGMILSIDRLNVGTAIYKIIVTSNVTHLTCAVDNPLLSQKVSAALLKPLEHPEYQSESPSSAHLGKRKASDYLKSYVNSWMYQELSSLHPYVISSAFRLLEENIGTRNSTFDKEPVKKKRKSQQPDVLHIYFMSCLDDLCSDNPAKVVEAVSLVLQCEQPSLGKYHLSLMEGLGNVLESSSMNSLSDSHVRVVCTFSLVLLRLLSDRESISNVIQIYRRYSNTPIGLTTIKSMDLKIVLQLLTSLPSSKVMNKEQFFNSIIKICMSETNLFIQAVDFFDTIGKELLSVLSSPGGIPKDDFALKSNLYVGFTLSCLQQINKINKQIKDWCYKQLETLAGVINKHTSSVVSSCDFCLLTCGILDHSLGSIDKSQLIKALESRLVLMHNNSQLAGAEKTLVQSWLNLVTSTICSLEDCASDSFFAAVWESLLHLAIISQEKDFSAVLWLFVEAISKDQLLTCLTRLQSYNLGNLPSAIGIIKALISQSSEDPDKGKLIQEFIKQFLVYCQLYMTDLAGLLSDGRSRQLFVNLLSLLSDLSSKGKMFMSSPNISSILTAMQFLNINDIPSCDLLGVFSSCQQLLKCVILNLGVAVANNSATYVAIATNLTLSLMHHANQNELTSKGITTAADLSAHESVLIACCQEINKILSAMSGHQIFKKLAAFYMTEIVTELVNVTLMPNVKQGLYLAINPMLDCCDEFAVMMLKVNLPEAQREIFKTIHEQFIKYHKYKGRI